MDFDAEIQRRTAALKQQQLQRQQYDAAVDIQRAHRGHRGRLAMHRREARLAPAAR